MRITIKFNVLTVELYVGILYKQILIIKNVKYFHQNIKCFQENFYCIISQYHMYCM